MDTLMAGNWDSAKVEMKGFWMDGQMVAPTVVLCCGTRE